VSPDRLGKLHRQQLKEALGDGAEHDKAFASAPMASGAFDMGGSRTLQSLVTLGSSRVTWQVFGPEAVTEGHQEIFQDIKHDLHSNSGTVELQGLDGVWLQVAAHQHQGAKASMGKDKPNEATGGFPDQIQRGHGDLFDLTIELAGDGGEEVAMIEDFHQGDLVAVASGAAARMGLWDWRWEVGDIVVFGAHDEGDPWNLVGHGPHASGECKHRCHGKIGIENQQHGLGVPYGHRQGHRHWPLRQGPLAWGRLNGTEMLKALMQTQLEGQAERGRLCWLMRF